ncbi:hypothetical protein M427DRAFT_136403 [Gonapodya prolifera JEL478]|uniref:Pentacotripeptide-repeat region of PRORP domain-containing protein n=1 Tax=Gonapodya prolifera (strain JEL478) TaxID=1344416 RepID=A0A139AA58_GONPJ|nr:hypothetical protein M427DRAFT_136403 [Gonapodya prolifera JEL478]|eukprot:KXS13620.1 hypothetical protein M427DRAFT_136403 [Gonapodya prolifera JEL478]
MAHSLNRIRASCRLAGGLHLLRDPGAFIARPSIFNVAPSLSLRARFSSTEDDALSILHSSSTTQQDGHDSRHRGRKARIESPQPNHRARRMERRSSISSPSLPTGYDVDLTPPKKYTFKNSKEALRAFLAGVESRISYTKTRVQDPTSLDDLWSMYLYIRSNHPDLLAELPDAAWPPIFIAFSPGTKSGKAMTGSRWFRANHAYVKHLKRVERIADDMEELAHHSPTVQDFQALVSAYKPLFTSWDEVERLFLNRMKRSSVPADSVIASQILSGLAGSRDLASLEKGWKVLYGSGDLKPNLFSYQALMQAYFNSPAQMIQSPGIIADAPMPGQYVRLTTEHPGYQSGMKIYETTRELFQGMKLQESTNLSFINTAIFAAARANDGKMVDQILDDLKNVWNGEPDIYTYTALAEHRANSGSLAAVLSLLEEVKLKALRPVSERRKPNVVFYTRIIKACFDLGEPGQAMEILKEMTREGVYPNVVTYNAIIDYYASIGNVEGLQTLTAEMDSRGIAPDVITYTSMLSTFKNIPSLPQSFATLKKMREKNIEPNKVSFVNVMDCCRNARSLQGVVDVLRWWGDVSSLEQHQECHAVLLTVLGHAHKWGLVLDFWNAKVRAYDTQTVQTVFLPYRGVMPWKIRPSIISQLSALAVIDNAGYQGTLDDVKRIWSESLRCGVKLTGNFASSLVEALGRRGDLESAERVVLVDIKESGLLLDPKTVSVLLNFAVKKNDSVKDGYEGLVKRIEAVWPGVVEEAAKVMEAYEEDKARSEQEWKEWKARVDLNFENRVDTTS